MDAYPPDASLPHPTEITRPFWDALSQRRVCIQRCGDCGRWVFYPRRRCNACLSDRLEWRTVSGHGRLYSFTVSRQPAPLRFPGVASPVLAIVELAEGIHMTSTLVNVDGVRVRIGMALKPFFDQVDEKLTLLKFQPE
jgi:uncharacterized OB-fold protein